MLGVANWCWSALLFLQLLHAGELEQKIQTQAAWLLWGGKDPAASASVVRWSTVSWVVAIDASLRAPPFFPLGLLFPHGSCRDRKQWFHAMRSSLCSREM